MLYYYTTDNFFKWQPYYSISALFATAKLRENKFYTIKKNTLKLSIEMNFSTHLFSSPSESVQPKQQQKADICAAIFVHARLLHRLHLLVFSHTRIISFQIPFVISMCCVHKCQKVVGKMCVHSLFNLAWNLNCYSQPSRKKYSNKICVIRRLESVNRI